ncbi:cytochrome P450 [Bipolaris maydis]|nr:cytochrome P450 [Bipolaris maydis]
MGRVQSFIKPTHNLRYDASFASIATAAVACFLGVLYFFIVDQRVATNATWYALTEDALKNPFKAREQWAVSAKEILYGGLEKIKGAIAVISSTGPLVFLPNSFADEIRNMKELQFGSYLIQGHYQGLTPFLVVDQHDVTHEVVRRNLTRSLDSITEDMNAEVEAVLMDMLGNVEDLKPFVHRLVARVSSCVFLAPELLENAEWIDIAVAYPENSMRAIYQLRSLHPISRPIAQWWMPALRVCRQQAAKSREIINPLKTNIDFAELQLFLSFAAVHITTEMISGLMCDLIENEHWMPQIREETVSTLSKHGWKNTLLASMKILDSAMKESQRLNKLIDLGMRRVVLSNTTLSNGTVIPKGYKTRRRNPLLGPDSLPNSEHFEADRFLKLRDTDQSKWYFVTGSPEHLGFGYGKHTCPGRFFASNEIKIIICYLLVKYDWKFAEEERLPTLFAGAEYIFNDKQKVEVKSSTFLVGVSVCLYIAQPFLSLLSARVLCRFMGVVLSGYSCEGGVQCR